MFDRVIDCLELNARHTRSISLSRDLGDPTATASYLPTPNAVQALKQIGIALQRGNPQRAWKVVGPYGSGKSALGLVLAQLLSGRDQNPAGWDMLNTVSPTVAALFSASKRYPVAIVGARLPIGVALGAEIHRALGTWPQAKGVSTFKKHLASSGHYKGRPINAVAGELIHDFAALARSQGYDGVLLLVDEVGKFVEHAAINPDAGDLIALQQLAEESCRQGDAALAMVVLQHQHFASYASGIGRALDDEWHKVASRFEEIAFDEPVERYAHFAAQALGVSGAFVAHAKLAPSARSLFDEALAQSILRAPSAADKELFAQAHRLYPLHPLSLAALAVISKRYGQSERSFHAFLNSHEPAGLRDFSQRASAVDAPWYRLPELFDYLASGSGLRFRDLAAERRWAFALGCVERQASQLDALQVLKSVAVLELVQVPLSLRITAELVAFSLGWTRKASTVALERLADQGLLVRRHGRLEYAFAVSDSINIEALYEQAAKEGDAELTIRGAAHALGRRIVVASKHYNRRGTIRTLGVDVGSLALWPGADSRATARASRPEPGSEPDGWLRVVLAPAGSGEESRVVERMRSTEAPLDLYCCLSLSAEGRAALSELAVWLQVQREVNAKRLDPWTTQYVDGRVHRAKEDVDATVLSALSPAAGRPGPVYWHQGDEVPGSTAMNVSQAASWLFDKVFHRAPRIVNELINKDRPASAIVLARQRLLEAVLAGPTGKPLFAASEFPPERLLHTTLLRDTGIWREEGTGWRLADPQPGARVDISAVWTEISLLLSSGTEVTFEDALAGLAAPPLGVRAGPASVWLTLYLMIHRGRCAVFERGTLVLELTSEHLQRMYKNPHTFGLRELPASQGGRNLLRDYAAALSALGVAPQGDATYLELARALYRWFARLSDFTQQSSRVSKEAALVRSALRKAQDPIKLLTLTLPQLHASVKGSTSFADWLSAALIDLGMAQRRLQDTVSAELAEAFRTSGTIGKIRSQLQAECTGVGSGLADARLKSFILRCTDITLTDEKWLDSVASLLVKLPLDAWVDDTIDLFNRSITEVAGQYRRWLRLVVERHGTSRAAERFVSLTMTSGSGEESALFLATTERSSAIAARLLELLAQESGNDSQTAAAALAQALQGLNVMSAQDTNAETQKDDQRQAG